MFLSFANAQEKHLPLLDRERQSIVESLRPLEDRDYFSVRHEPSITRDILSTYLTEYKDRIILFHYAGHAGSDKIFATDGGAFAGGLAALLGQMPNLQLVFLNGCSTQGQVEQLLKAGVKAVIGTSVPVRDDIATEFSIGFYQALAAGQHVTDAYLAGRGRVLMMRNNISIPEKGVRLADLVSTEVSTRAEGGAELHTSDALPWGLFEKEDDGIIEWKLPSRPPIVPVAPSPLSEGDLNDALRVQMFEILAPYDPLLRFSWEQEKAGDKVSPRVVQQQIIDALPIPLGQEVRRIFSTTEYSLERLQLFLRTYRCLLQLLTYSLLAQLWDLLFAKPDHPLDQELKSIVRKFLVADDEKRTFDDYVALIRTLRLHFTTAGVQIFIDELSELSNRFNNLPEMQKAHKNLESLRVRVQNNPDIAPNDLVTFNKSAEESLGVMFRELGIVCRYKFVTIKDIDLIKRRHRKPEFRIQKVNLDRLTAGLMDEFPTDESFTDNHSVILLKSAKKFDQYLNLSPFLIDEHALIKQMQKSKLFMFSSYEEDTGKINYHLVLENAQQAQLDSSIYPAVQNEFMAFKQAVLG